MFMFSDRYALRLPVDRVAGNALKFPSFRLKAFTPPCFLWQLWRTHVCLEKFICSAAPAPSRALTGESIALNANRGYRIVSPLLPSSLPEKILKRCPAVTWMLVASCDSYWPATQVALAPTLPPYVTQGSTYNLIHIACSLCRHFSGVGAGSAQGRSGSSLRYSEVRSDSLPQSVLSVVLIANLCSLLSSVSCRLMAALEHVGILRRVLAFPVDRDSLLSPRPPCSERTITYSGHYGASGGAMTSSKCTGVESALAAAFRLEVPPADVLASVVAAGGVVVYK
jgi:hypothetical protein